MKNKIQQTKQHHFGLVQHEVINFKIFIDEDQ